MSRFIQNITIENRQVDRENLFVIGYCPEIEKPLLCVHISWIVQATTAIMSWMKAIGLSLKSIEKYFSKNMKKKSRHT